MWKRVAISGFCLLLSVVAFSGNGDLEIKMVNKDTIKVMPGSTSNIVVKLINNTATSKDFLLKIESPQGWKCLTNLGAVSVEKSSNQIKILSMYSPEFTKSGNYTISIEAFDKTDNSKIGSISATVFVQANYEILLNAYQPPNYVVSGDSLAVKFMLQNLSNVEARISTILKSENKSDYQTFILAPDSFVIFNKAIVTTKNLLQYQKQNIGFEAFIDNKPETKKKPIPLL